MSLKFEKENSLGSLVPQNGSRRISRYFDKKRTIQGRPFDAGKKITYDVDEHRSLMQVK